ncbi:related to single-stranded DNA-binding protein [Phialocephala subalpina]|uniref:Related to single-stranded DNA-binding protein n=1 Tax=Phialocephala subalpina TaxID=576137 RepID=A0A1L7WP25_9HELO|nr:related to single-stranded DNA-binding protein [Phialocephala subalpina]
MSFLARRTASALPKARLFSTSAANRSSFAKMTIVGRLTAQPELQATSTGREILKYGVATDSGRGDNKKTSFFNVTSFTPEGTQRDFIQSLDKGTFVYVEAEPSMNYYQDAEGKNRSSLGLVQQKLEVLQFRKREEGGASVAE